MTEKEKKIWHKECAYAYFLENVPGFGKKITALLWNEYKSYEAIYREADKSLQLKKNEKLRQAFCKQKDTWDIEKKYGELKDSGVFCMPKELTGYPKILKEFSDAPSVLFVRGKLPDENKPLVAVIGARSCTNYGAYIAQELGKRLAYEEIGVISGLARGIDGIGQLASLTHGGATYGVLGSGVDICYPEENRALYQRLCSGECNGGIISEFLPKTEAKSCLFPVRNRIISGMADAVVVVEAKEKSGTFITVSRALEQGKDVYAIPGRLTDPLSTGCLKLIEQGAGLIWNLDIFIQKIKEDKAYQLTKKCISGEKPEQLMLKTPHGMTPLQKDIYEAVDFCFQDLNSILCKLEETDMSKILAALSELEYKKIIEQESGFYRRFLPLKN